MAPQKGKQAGGSSGLRGFYLVLAAVALAGIAAVGYAVLGGTSGATEPVAIEGLEDPQALLEAAAGVGLGDPEAPVKILEFGDYQCPACRQWATRVEPYLKLEYVATGKAYFVFYDYPLTDMHPNAFLAARAARCAGAQDRYWDYHNLLFAKHAEWSGEGDPGGEFVSYAADLGLDAGAFEACLDSNRFAETVSAGQELAKRLGIHATPTLIVNGNAAPDPRYNALKAMIESALAEADTAAEAGA